jgi:hypothetical protein
MKRPEREALIDRYLSGEMDPAEEQDFFIRAAVDKELRFELKAQQTIASAIRKDSVLPAEDHLAVHTHVFAMLGTTVGSVPSEADAATDLRASGAAVAESSATTAGSSGRTGRWLFSGLVLVGLLVGIAAWMVGGNQTGESRSEHVSGTRPDSTAGSVGAKSAMPSATASVPETDSTKATPGIATPQLSDTRRNVVPTNARPSNAAVRRSGKNAMPEANRSEGTVDSKRNRPADDNVSVEGTVTVHVPK